MHVNETIAGYECNMIVSKDGKTIRSIAILVGDENTPGSRRKDGDAAMKLRREAREAVKAALASDPRAVWILANNRSTRLSKITVFSRYSELVELPNGMIARRAADGKTIGVYLP